MSPIHKLTQRLELREWTASPSDYETMYNLESIPEVDTVLTIASRSVRYQEWAPRSRETCVQVVDVIVEGQRADPRTHVELAVSTKDESGQEVFLGRVGSNIDFSAQPVKADLWFAFMPISQGKGFATEAVEALIEILYDAGVRKLDIECDPRNKGSWRLAERLKFTKVKETENAWESKGEWVGSLEYSKLLE